MEQKNNQIAPIYVEKITSLGTSLFFAFLSALFFLLFVWRLSLVGWRFFTGLYIVLGLFFLFYVFNYRVLDIMITKEHLILKFGLVPWKTRLKNINTVELDASPAIIKYGGAGVHFAFVQGKYRAYYNFLEFPRVVVSFKEKQGLIQALVFSTKQPDRVLAALNSRMENL
jgi:hypothetical protein